MIAEDILDLDYIDDSWITVEDSLYIKRRHRMNKIVTGTRSNIERIPKRKKNLKKHPKNTKRKNKLRKEQRY